MTRRTEKWPNHRPDADEIRAFLDQHGLTQREAAERIRVDPRTFRRYVSTDPEDYQSIPYVAWFTLVVKVRFDIP